jgi:hypothetical protein
VFSLDSTRSNMVLFGIVWAATTKDKDYIRMEGMKRVVNDAVHRKELVAGNLKEFMAAGEFAPAFFRCATPQWSVGDRVPATLY